MTQTQLNPLSTGLYLHLLFNPTEIFTTFTDFENWSIRGVAADLFSLRRPKNFEYEKFFLCLKIAKIDMGGQFWVEKNDSGHKEPFINVKPVFRG